MSDERLELVRNAFQALAAGGLDAALRFCPSDVVWCTTDRWVEGSTYRGHDGMRRLAEGFSQNFDGWGYEVQDIRDAQDCLVALVYMSGTIKNSERSISQPLGLVISDFRDGTFGCIRVFPNWQEALNAAGLEDPA